MNSFCCNMAILLLVSSVNCMYIQDPLEMPRTQALVRIREGQVAAAPRTVIVTNPARPSQYTTTYVDPNLNYGANSMSGAMYVNPNPNYRANSMARGSTVVINVAEDQDPYYAAAMPARTIRI